MAPVFTAEFNQFATRLSKAGLCFSLPVNTWEKPPRSDLGSSF
ncbi:MAG: hypothetical protein ACK421_07825 [Pseudanabaenaceae cyanobacterium]